MKKYLLTIILLITLALTGCSNQSNLEKAAKKISDAQSYVVEYNLDTILLTGGVEHTHKTNLVFKGDMIFNRYEIDTSETNFDENLAFKTYIEEQENAYVYYVSVDDYYEKTVDEKRSFTEEQLKHLKQELENDKFLDLIKASLKTKKVNSDVEGETKYQLTISKNAINNFLDVGYNGIFGNVDVDDDVILQVYLAKDNISRIRVDFMPYLSQENQMNYKKYIAEIKFSELNNTQVNIPEEIRNKAIETTAEGEE